MSTEFSLAIPSKAEDYYWRNFYGSIPDDAIIGSENFGYKQYIGRGPVGRRGLFVGQIIPGASTITVATAKNLHIIGDHLDILCSSNPSNFKWVLTDSSSIAALSGLVKVGYHFKSSKNLYLGRIMVENHGYAIGHVSPSGHFYYNDRSVLDSTFEVLIHTS